LRLQGSRDAVSTAGAEELRRYVSGGGWSG
jgi:hypothetical protein